MPRRKTPDLTVPTLDHGDFNLAIEQSERGTIVCFFRARYCPICANYLTELDKRVGEFAERGVTVIALSADTEERTRAMANKIGNKNIGFGHCLDLSVARRMGIVYLDFTRRDVHRHRRARPVFRTRPDHGVTARER